MGFRNLLVKVGLAAANVAAKFDPSGVAASLLDAYSKRQEKQQLRSELDEMISAGFQRFRDELGEAMGELKVQLSDRMRPQVEAYLSQFQTSAKQASRALGDPSATTVPATVALDEPEQLAAFLPQRPPRFNVGDSVPGLPSWKLIEPLGLGGFGEVWKAEHPYSGTAAFKFFLDPTARNRFTHMEARNLAEIFKRAPTDGVVKLLLAEPGQDPPWLQFEYISGGDLSRLAEAWKRLVAEERVQRVGRAIQTLAKTTGHFHNLGVVHRDLKPSNILLREIGTGDGLVIADFGISKIVPTGSSSLPTPANSGTATIQAYTALYASPQQKRFLPADRRDDVYALGVLWYQLLRGDLTLERPSGESWKRALKHLGVSEATIGLLNRCWDDEADERPKDGNALLDAIKELDPPVIEPVQPPGIVPPIITMTVEDAIQQLERAGGVRGATATDGNKHYKTVAQLRFQRCPCSWGDLEYNCHEFIARNTRGTCYYVSHNLGTGKITIGSSGYHFRIPEVPECIPGSAPRRRSSSHERNRLGRLLEEREMPPIRANLWFRPLESESGVWQLPHGITERFAIYDGEAYFLQFDPRANDEDLTGLDALADLQQLHTISVEQGTDLTATSYSRLGRFRHLSVLNLDGSSVDDSAMEFFVGLAALTSLSLCGCQRVTDEGLIHLYDLTNLKTLNLEGTKVTQKGVSRLRQALPKCEVEGM
jgi:serine/threonine protein kinase